MTTGTQLQISDGTYTTTLNVGGTFTLRTASGSTTVAIDFAAGGAIKLGGTQIVGSATFDPLAAITNLTNISGKLSATSASVLANSNLAFGNVADLEELSIMTPRQSAPWISLDPQQDGSLDSVSYDLSIKPIDYQMSQAYDKLSLATADDSSKRMAIASDENDTVFQADYISGPYAGPQFIDLDLSALTRPESILDFEIWTDLRHGHNNLPGVATNYFDDKTPFQTSITPDAVSYVM